MRKVIGICNLHDGPHLGQLTANRPLGVVSFLGRYGLIDFTLSNFSNSGIAHVYTLVENGILSVRNHILDGSVWVSNTKTGFLRLVYNEKVLSNPKFNTDIANVFSSLTPLDRTIDYDYVIVAPPFFLTKMDFNKIIKAHIESKKEISIVYTHRTDLDKEFINCDLLKIDKDSKITKTFLNSGKEVEGDVSLETYIFSKNSFIKFVNSAPRISLLFTFRKMITYYINNHVMDINAIKHLDYVFPILSMKDYVRHSFNLLNYHIRSLLFDPSWPIYTTTHNTPPVLYTCDAQVKNSFIANGSIIKGKVENSIISRDVIIERGAVVKNSIIFTNTTIGSGVKISYVLSDKNVNIKEVKNLVGDEEDVLYIEQGANI